jgi:hypothetical protein
MLKVLNLKKDAKKEGANSNDAVANNGTHVNGVQ